MASPGARCNGKLLHLQWQQHQRMADPGPRCDSKLRHLQWQQQWRQHPLTVAAGRGDDSARHFPNIIINLDHGRSDDSTRDFPNTIINLDHGRSRRKVRWQTVASTMATAPTMVINSGSARTSQIASDDRHKGRSRSNNGPTFRCPQP